MGAQIRIMPQDEADQGFGLLKDIVEMVKNPKAIDEAYDRRRKAAALSDDEVAKAMEARAMLAKADALRLELQQKEAALSAMQIEHTSNVSLYAKQVQSENDRLKKREDELQAKSELQSKIDEDQAATKARLAEYSAKIDSDNAQKEKIYNDKLTAIANKDAEQLAEDKRLADWAEKLKAKAKRLAAEADKDD